MTWAIANRSVAGAAATASVAASPDGGRVARLRSLQASISGTAAGTGQLVVRDGPSVTGAVIFTIDIVAAANAGVSVVTALDLRASVGNVLTVEFAAGTTSDFQSVSAQGDYAPSGQPYGAS